MNESFQNDRPVGSLFDRDSIHFDWHLVYRFEIYFIIIFPEIHQHSFAYMVTVYEMANMNQDEKRRVSR
jgi:hypothetical protein